MPGEVHQLPDALIGRRGQLREQEAVLLGILSQLFDRLAVLAQQVGLVRHDDLRTRREKLAVTGQFGIDLLDVIDRIAALAARRIDQMQQQAAAVDMAQKVMTEAGALARALDDARDVRHDEVLLLAHGNHAQIGDKGREVVVCDLGTRRRNHAQQRRLADVRKADQTDVREQLELEHDVALHTRQTRLREARRLTGRGREMGVAPAAVAALCRDIRLVIRHILHDLSGFLVADDRAARHADHEVRAILALAALAAARLARRSHVFLLVAEVEKRGQVVVHLEDDRTASSAVAAVRTARRNILFAVEADLAVAALAGHDLDLGNINKHDSCSSFQISCRKTIVFPTICVLTDAKHGRPKVPIRKLFPS